MAGFFNHLRNSIAPTFGAGVQPATKGSIGSGAMAPSHGRKISTQAPEIVLSERPVTAQVGSNGARLDGLAHTTPLNDRTIDIDPAAGTQRVDAPQTDATATPSGSRLALRQHNPLRDANVEMEVEVDLARVEILSLSGVLEANAEQRKLLCYLSDGRLLVAAGKERFSAQVLSYIALLERHSKRYVAVQTRPAKIIALYEQGGAGRTGNADKANLNTKAKATSLQIINDASTARASDIHLEKLHDHATLKFRIDGELESVTEYPPELGMSLIRTFYQVLADIGSETFKANERLDARIGRGPSLPPGLDGIRIATTPTAEGNKMVMRLLYSMVNDSFDLGELGMGPVHTEMFEALKQLPIGLNIISGPTGSGKSTTLQRTLRGYIDQTKGTKHVITVEDPPEYPIPGAVQTPVANANSQEKRTEVFTAAIASAMRLDPDVIMIGEVRDLPSANLALRAATTGHQVWTTLHANNALNIIDRLVNMGMDKDMLLDHTVLTGLVSQRLIRKLCPRCKTPLSDRRSSFDPKQLGQLERTFGDAFDKLYVTGSGCDCCRGGTAGRTVVAEVIRPTAQLCALLQDGKRVEARHHWLTDMKGESFMQHAIHKIQDGLVDPFAAWKMLGPLVSDADVLSN